MLGYIFITSSRQRAVLPLTEEWRSTPRFEADTAAHKAQKLPAPAVSSN